MQNSYFRLFGNDNINRMRMCTAHTLQRPGCTPDSGAILTYSNNVGRKILVGIDTHEWAHCGAAKAGSSLFTKITAYTQWIYSQGVNACTVSYWE